MGLLIDSLVGRLKRGQTTNSTSTSFSALISTTTKPAASATRTIISHTGLHETDETSLCIAPYGGNDNNDTFSIKVSGWRRFNTQLVSVDQWVSFGIAEVACTLSSTLLGLANQHVVATEFFCDVLTLAWGSAAVTQGATADLDTAYFSIEAGQYELIEVTYDLTTGGDSANCVYWWE